MNAALPPPAILVVEDDPNDRELLEAALRSTGWSQPIEFFGNGAALIECLRTSPAFRRPFAPPTPCLLFLDLHMPQVDGCGVIAWIRKQFPPSAIRIIVLSGSGDSADMKRAASLGADRLMTKPLGDAALQAEIQHLKASAA